MHETCIGGVHFQINEDAHLQYPFSLPTVFGLFSDMILHFYLSDKTFFYRLISAFLGNFLHLGKQVIVFRPFCRLQILVLLQDLQLFVILLRL